MAKPGARFDGSRVTPCIPCLSSGAHPRSTTLNTQNSPDKSLFCSISLTTSNGSILLQTPYTPVQLFRSSPILSVVSHAVDLL